MADLLLIASKTFHNEISDNKVTSPYGMRKHPVTGEYKMHNGVDFSSKTLPWKQYPLEDGYVYDAGVDTQYGSTLYAWIAYPRLGVRVLHYHLAELYVKTGQKVNKDTVIGLTGKTGYSDGVHLHFGVKWLSNGAYFNPADLDLKLELTATTYSGVWDSGFTKLLQAHFGTYQDGVISGQLNAYSTIKNIYWGKSGSALIRAMEKWAGRPIDGQLSNADIKAFQAKMGAYQDGTISINSSFVKAVRKAIAEGTMPK